MYFAYVVETKQPGNHERDFYACMYHADTEHQARELANTKFVQGWHPQLPSVLEFSFVGSTEKDSHGLYEKACLQAERRSKAEAKKEPGISQRVAPIQQPAELERAAPFEQSEPDKCAASYQQPDKCNLAVPANQPGQAKPLEPVLKHAW